MLKEYANLKCSTKNVNYVSHPYVVLSRFHTSHSVAGDCQTIGYYGTSQNRH